MKYTPSNHKPEDLLQKLGFTSANRGYALDRRRPGPKKPVRIHALIQEGEITLHSDYRDEKGVHYSGKHEGRLGRFVEILDSADKGEPMNVSKKMKKNYKFSDFVYDEAVEKN